jgi:hypothetical protein
MGCQVYANGNSIACKAADGKSIAAMPDVCFTPPLTPATPPGVPIPYPNTGMASDTTNGSKTVMISDQEVMLKNQSYFKQSTGDEAGSAPKKGVVTSQIKGKVNFCAWSMDVKFEGENVPRHLDLTGHNEASDPPNTPPWAYLDSMTAPELEKCANLKNNVEDKCGEHIQKNTYSSGRVNRAGAMKDMCNDEKCTKASECMLVEYGGSGSPNCCPGTTGHHLVPVHCFMPPGARKSGEDPYGDWPKYDGDKAPTACVEGSSKELEHGELHEKFDAAEDKNLVDGKAGSWSFAEARNEAAKSLKEVNTACDEDCTKAQLDAYHRNACKDKDQLDSTPLRADSTGRRTPEGFTPSRTNTGDIG